MLSKHTLKHKIQPNALKIWNVVMYEFQSFEITRISDCKTETEISWKKIQQIEYCGLALKNGTPQSHQIFEGATTTPGKQTELSSSK